jgi:hypothetical protein
MLKTIYQNIVDTLLNECKSFYGERLVSFCLYGSVARGKMNYTSDIDFLIVANNLPEGRVKRVTEFAAVEKKLQPLLLDGRKFGIYAELSPLLKTPEEVQAGSLIFLDMLEDGKILFDRDGLLQGYFGKLRKRLQELGAKRVWMGEAWYWILKADYKPGEVFEI